MPKKKSKSKAKPKRAKAKPKKRAKKAAAKAKAAPKAGAGKKLIGTVGHYFDRISVAVVDLKSELKVGDKISFEGPKTNFKQKVSSMQIEYKAVKAAKKGASVGMKVVSPVREKDMVYKV